MKIKKFDNGLKLVINSKNDTNIVSFKIFVKAGSMDETEENYGVAHFLEHMFFKSTKYHSATEILTKFDFLGASQNAYTSNTKTCYYFQSLSENLEKCVELYSEMFFNTEFNEQEIENERNVIIEEYKRGEDTPASKAVMQAVGSLFYNTPFEHDVIGTKDTILAMDKNKLIDFKNKFYTAKNVVISVSGNAKISYITKLIKKYFINKFNKLEENPRKNEYYELKLKNKYIAKDKDNQQSVVYILTDLGGLSLHQRRVAMLYYAILGLDMSSKLFQKIREEKGYVYNISANTSLLLKNALGEIIFSTSHENVDEALKEIRKVIKSCSDGEISEQELVKVKNKIISEMVFDEETNSAIASASGASLIDKGYIEKDKDIINDIKSITLDEIKECAKNVYHNKKFVVSSVGKCTKEQLKVFK